MLPAISTGHSQSGRAGGRVTAFYQVGSFGHAGTRDLLLDVCVACNPEKKLNVLKTAIICRDHSSA